MTIPMSVFLRSGRNHYEVQWLDPTTEKYRTRTTGTAIERDAHRFAAKLMAEIEAGDGAAIKQISWEQFQAIYKADRFPSLRKKTQVKISGTLKLITNVVDPARLSSIRETQIAEIKAELVRRKRSQYTIISHLSILRKMFAWAVRQKYLARAPEIEMPSTPADANRGRPVTGEEFDRMVRATEKIVGEERAPGWTHLLEGLRLSGFRLDEALKFHWQDDHQISPDLSGKRPLLRIQGTAEKAGTFRLLPMTPDFSAWLLKTPEAERKGYVFRPMAQKRGRSSVENAGKTISAIGEAAGVKVSPTKFASSHDLRRTFGLKWALKVRPAILMALMRHASITTTLKFYAHVEAQTAADEIWRGETNSSTNTRKKTTKNL